MKLLTCLFLTVAVLICSPVMAVYGVGDHVSDFTLNDSTGTSVSLYSFEGMAVLISFWGDC